MKLSDIILAESTKVVSLKDLTFDLLVSIFRDKPLFGFNLPNPDDTSNSVNSDTQLGYWKSKIEDRYGNVNIKIDTEASSPWEKIQVLDDKFRADKKAYVDSKAAWLDKERQAGRSFGLD